MVILGARDAAAPAPRTAPAFPFFRFGGDDSQGSPLAIVSGGLIYDRGEAERTFIYRCQDRFLVYSSLCGLRSVFFVASERHAAIYRARIAAQRGLFDDIRRRSGLFADRHVVEPLYVGCDIDTLRVFAPRGFAVQCRTAAESAGAGVALNQVSPTYAVLVGEIEALLRRHGIAVRWDVPECERLGRLAWQYSDKADYLSMVAGARELPPHVETVALSAAELQVVRGYADLAALYRERAGTAAPERLFLKATVNSAGNLAALVDADTAAAQLNRIRDLLAREAATDGPALDGQVRELVQEVDDAPCLRPLALSRRRLRAVKREQAKRRQVVDFLLQPQVCGASGDGAFAGLGLNWLIAADGSVQPICVNAQIYRDPDRKHFLGAFLSAATARAAGASFELGVRALCGAYARRGYRGPIGFDARRTREGGYALIYDCNPRLSGVFPSLAVRDALVQSGIAIDSVLTLGYRGEFVLADPAATLEALDRRGLLCSRKNPRGAVILPNLCRDDGFDMHLVNVAPDDAERLLAPGGALAAHCAAPSMPRRLYW